MILALILTALVIIATIVVVVVIKKYKIGKNNSLEVKKDTMIKAGIQSEYFVGKSFKLDPSLKYLIDNPAMQFPTKELRIESIDYFSIEGNMIYVISFTDNYLGLWDEYEQKLFIMQKIMECVLDNSDISNDHIELTDNDTRKTYEYFDDSGLLQVSLKPINDEHSLPNNRLVRMYNRQLSDKSSMEWLLIMEQKIGRASYYVGYSIEKSQLIS
jgi:hypothetical protein